MDIGKDKSGIFFRNSESESPSFGGRGDMDMDNLSPKKQLSQTTSRYVTKEFCNGVSVPVYINNFSEDEYEAKCQSGLSHVKHKRPIRSNTSFSHLDKDRKQRVNNDGDKTQFSGSEIMSFFQCPICMDLMIEVTAASCGHTFCAKCLDDWYKLKPICPVCSKEITCLTRVFNQDQIIDMMIRNCNDIPSELGLRHYEATITRMDRQAAEKKKGKGLLRKIRNGMDDLLISVKCKGLWTTVKNKIPSPGKRIKQTWNYRNQQTPQSTINNSSWFGPKSFLFLGASFGALTVFAITNFQSVNNFFEYIYRVIVQYDGTIPPYLYGTAEEKTPHGGAENKTATPTGWFQGCLKAVGLSN